MDKVKRQYQKAYNKHGNSLQSVFIPKGRQRERFDSLLRYVDAEQFSLLDYGCGLGQLALYIKERFPLASYHGVDIVDEFISENKQNYSETSFSLIKDCFDLDQQYDVIIAAGVFNLLYVENIDEHQKIVFENLKHLFSKTNYILSVNFMTDKVDYIQEGAFHQNVMSLYEFAKSELTKRIALDESYMPYEFTFHFFKDETVLKPDNIYKL